jgi:hypothetical protein
MRMIIITVGTHDSLQTALENHISPSLSSLIRTEIAWFLLNLLDHSRCISSGLLIGANNLPFYSRKVSCV